MPVELGSVMFRAAAVPSQYGDGYIDIGLLADCYSGILQNLSVQLSESDR